MTDDDRTACATVTDLDSGSDDSNRKQESRLELYSHISALWLANLLAIAALVGAWYSENFLSKHWHPDEWALLLIAAPYGGLLWRRISGSVRK